jgi:hypothetical protein
MAMTKFALTPGHGALRIYATITALDNALQATTTSESERSWLGRQRRLRAFDVVLEHELLEVDSVGAKQDADQA